MDDILLASSDLDLLHETKNFFIKFFDRKNIKNIFYIFDIKIHHDRSKKLLGCSQKTYITRILERFRMLSYSSSEVPIIKDDKFNKF